tara:strand:+ start:2205 stop:2624 length:420 start_codon:yes stop_codon:yes gene_type:complete
MALGLATNTIQTGGGTVSAGTNITGFSAKVMYDKGVSEDPKPRVLKAQFGDGYEMRVGDGINTLPKSWSLKFENRTKADVDNLYKFFNELAGVSTCKLTVPHAVDGEQTYTVVIEDWKRNLQYHDYYTIDCKARQVFEP